MKKILAFIILPLISFSQAELFTKLEKYYPNLTHNPKNTILLNLNTDLIENTSLQKPCFINTKIPFLNNEELSINLEYFEVFKNDFGVGRTSENGLMKGHYTPKTISYKIIGPNNLSGSISIYKNRLVGVIKRDGKMYELVHLGNNHYALIDISDSIYDVNFTMAAAQ